MESAFLKIGIFLINTLFSFYIIMVLLRFLLQWVKADFYNPICQLLMKITNPLLVPLRKIIPGFFGLDLAAIVLMLVLQIIALALMSAMLSIPIGIGIILAAIIKLVLLTINVYFFAIIIRALASWLNPNPYHPASMALIQLTEPILAPIRRVVPSIAGFDLSPIVALILLQVLLIFLRSIFG